jgi:hypothetical protein
MNFDFNPDPDPTSRSIADPDPTSALQLTMELNFTVRLEIHFFLSCVVDLRTNDTEQRIKRENNLETLRRLAHVNAVAAGGGGPGGLTERESQQLATIQKMDILRQAANVGRDHFLGGRGGFGAPLTAPLGIPASDLARIAQTVPDPAAASGEPTSGTGKPLSPPHTYYSAYFCFMSTESSNIAG